MKNQRLLNSLMKQPTDCTPVWIMRQAGRYLPEYREIRAKAGDFLTLCKNPELACEVTLQPLERFDLDAAILFSDILTIPDAMGLGLYFETGEGPRFERPIRSAADVDKLPIPDPEQELRYVPDTVRLVRAALNGKVPLIGFAGSPWTLATYMVEGGPSKAFTVIKAMLYREPKTLHQLLSKITQATIDYLNAQIAAGAQAIKIFDSWGGILSTEHYQAFSLDYMRQIIAGIKAVPENQNVPIIVFTKQGNSWLELIADSGCDAVGVDWTIDLKEVFARIGDKVAVEGNLDPSALYAEPEQIRAEVKKILAQVPKNVGHVFNLGHGISQDVPPEHVKVLVDAVHEFSR